VDRRVGIVGQVALVEVEIGLKKGPQHYVERPSQTEKETVMGRFKDGQMEGDIRLDRLCRRDIVEPTSKGDDCGSFRGGRFHRGHGGCAGLDELTKLRHLAAERRV
jgi:hypothetical protein